MNVIVSTRLLGAIMVASLASAASGMDLSQQPAPGGDETPALRLPAFLDIARLPDLQDAWRLHAAGTAREATAPSIPAVAATPAPAEDEGALETARAALTRAEQVSREAAVVRERAEELSRRFGAEPASDASAAAEPETPVPTETASIEPSAAPPEAPLPPPAHVLAPDDAAAVASQTEASQNEAAQSEASQSEPVDVPARKPAAKKKTAAVDGAPVIEEMATNKPARSAKRSTDGATARQITQVTNTKPTTPGLMVFEDSPTQPEHDPSKMLPTQLRSFGWNDQP